MGNLPTEGPVILVTNCKDLSSSLQLVSATDRTTKVILVEDGLTHQTGGMLRALALRSNLILVQFDADGLSAWADTKAEALRTLQGGHLLAIMRGRPERRRPGCVRRATAAGNRGAAVARLLRLARRRRRRRHAPGARCASARP